MNKAMRAIVGTLLAGSMTFAATGVASASTVDYPNKTTRGFELATGSSAGERELAISASGASAASHSSTCPATGAVPLRLEPASPEVARGLVHRTQGLQFLSILKTDIPSSSLDYNRASVHQIETSEGTGYTVTVPITGLHFLSNLSVLYGPDKELSNYAETRVEQTSDGEFYIKQWTNGAKSRDEVVAVDSLSDTSGKPEVTIQSWGQAVACLAGTLGVSGGVAKLILVLCGGACAVPEPTFSKAVCIACVGGMVTVGGGAISAVVKCFGYW